MRSLPRILLSAVAVFALVCASGCGTRLKPPAYSDFFARANLRIATAAKELRAGLGVDNGAPANAGQVHSAYSNIKKALDEVEDSLGDVAWQGWEGRNVYRAYQSFLKVEWDIYNNELADLVKEVDSGGNPSKIAELLRNIERREKPALEDLQKAQKTYAGRLALDLTRSRSVGGKR